MHSDWLKQPALSANKAQVDDRKLAFKLLFQNFDKFGPNYTCTCPVTPTNAIEIFVSSKYGFTETKLLTTKVLKLRLNTCNKFC